MAPSDRLPRLGRETCEKEGADVIGYPTTEAQVEHDFDRARRRAFARRVLNRLRGSGESDRLLSFDEVKASLAGWSQAYRGLRLVEVDKIVGSVGRHREFDGSFLPRGGSSETRWKRIDRAFHRAEYLPPVSLYEVGGLYYVRDGNHRVSVARFHGVREIEAEVVQVRGPQKPAYGAAA
jgi:hypothetical protein